MKTPEQIATEVIDQMHGGAREEAIVAAAIRAAIRDALAENQAKATADEVPLHRWEDDGGAVAAMFDRLANAGKERRGERDLRYGPCGFRHHAADCDCDGVGGDR